MNMNLTDIGTGESTNNDYVNTGVRVALIFPICFGNSLVIAAIRRTSSLRNPAHYLVMHLAIADMIVGLLVLVYIPLKVQNALDTYVYVCVFSFSSIVTTAMASTLFLLSIAVDRYISIASPLRYTIMMTSSRVHRASIAIWLISISLFLVIPLIWHNDFDGGTRKDCDLLKMNKREYLAYFAVPQFVCLAAVIVGLYCRVFYIAHRNGNRRVVTETRARQRLNSNLKIFQMAAIIFGFFGLCWFPSLVLMGVYVYSDTVPMDVLTKAYKYASSLVLVNSALNPAIYTWQSKRIRRAFKKLLHIKTERFANGSSVRAGRYESQSHTESSISLTLNSQRSKARTAL
ncbi:alpha-2B adrenergic receptor [Lingula anatina]|uniref:Alpha-2B adrenergic receptor n=1 Tax=Lingula anatina TaxID=7574 RepID=A0A1S3KEV7_LINAN|nr:alpha-2B adrenergic receptor [Lingula anatina]|eukprot:XP_013421163.1 alpha-2B adrenergic receptor [Lingula anatina]